VTEEWFVLIAPTISERGIVARATLKEGAPYYGIEVNKANCERVRRKLAVLINTKSEVRDEPGVTAPHLDDTCSFLMTMFENK
jgi:hypothetical protein